MTAAPATATAIAAHLQLKFGAGSDAKQFRQSYPFLRIVAKQFADGEPETATQVVTFARGDSAGSSFHTPGGAYPDEQTPIRTAASWNWAEVAQSIGINDLARGIATQNRLPEGQALMTSEAGSAIHVVYKDLETYAFTGDHTASPAELAGLTTAFATSGTYAGINPATSGQEAWVGKSASVTTASFEADPVAVLRANILGPIADEGGSADFAFCRSGIIHKILNTVSGAESHMRLSVRTVDGRDIPVSELGSVAVKVDNTWFVENPLAPANKIAVISSEDITLKMIRQEQMSADQIAEAINATGVLNKMLTPSVVEALLSRRLDLPPFYFDPIAKTGTKQRVGIAAQMQLTYRQRRTGGVLSLT